MRTLARAGKQPVPLREACAERLVAGRGNVTALRTGSSSVKADRNRDRPDVLLACGARDPLARLSHDDDARTRRSGRRTPPLTPLDRRNPMSFSTESETERPGMTRAVQALIAINVAIYFLQIALVGDADMWGWLAFDRGDLATSLWTVGTYAFVHAGFWHIALNMYSLWMFGPRVEQAWSGGRFVAFYLWCALGGVLGHLMFGEGGSLMGASAAVMGVMLAYAMHWPDDELLFFGVIPMKVKWFVTLLIVLNVVQGVG